MEKCPSADKYKAVHPPRCGGPDGPCDTCKEKWDASRERAALAEIIDRLEVALREIASRQRMLGECWSIAEKALERGLATVGTRNQP